MARHGAGPCGQGDTGAHLRPTSDRVRESLFSILTSRGVIDGARVLDLFAGTGALALEALSRGAVQAVLVENGRVGQQLITENIKKLHAEDTATLMRNDATRLGAWIAAPLIWCSLIRPMARAWATAPCALPWPVAGSPRGLRGLGRERADASAAGIFPGGRTPFRRHPRDAAGKGLTRTLA